MAVFTTEAIVLKQFDLGEADKIITFYTKDKGKVRAVAKNARKGNNKISGRVLPFTYSEITVYRGSSIDRINKIDNKYSFTLLREDLNKMAYASYMAEIVEKVGMVDNSNPQLFNLLLMSFQKLVNFPEKKFKYINLVFKLGVLSILGLKPVIDQCVICEKPLKISSRNIFAIDQGGIICINCIEKKETGESNYQLSGEALQVIKSILKSGFKIPQNLKITDRGFNNIDELAEKFIQYHLDIELKSRDFLNMIRNLG